MEVLSILPILFSVTPFSGQVAMFIGVSLLFGIGFTAMFYLLSYVLNHPPLNALAKEELAALIMTIFIVGGWFFIQAFLWNITCGLAFGTCEFQENVAVIPSTHISVASAALEILFLKLKSTYLSLYLYEVLIGFLSTVYVPIGTFNPMLALLPISMPPLAGLVLLSNAHTVLVEAIGMTMIAVIAKQHLLVFANYAVPLVLLPMGLVLRAVPFYRTTGSSIIAMCIALYFVYPLSVILSNYMIFDLYKPADFVYAPTAIGFCKAQANGVSAEDALKEKANDIYDLRKEWGEITAIEPMKSEEKGALTSIVSWAKGLVSMIESAGKSAFTILKFMLRLFGEFSFGIMSIFWGGGLHFGIISGLFYFITEEVAIVSQFVILVIVTSVFEIIITVTMYRNISMLIQGEIDIAGLSKIV